MEWVRSKIQGFLSLNWIISIPVKAIPV
jgi:hypothetical protein